MATTERWIGIAEESVYGTKVGTPEESLAFIDHDLQPDQGILYTDESVYEEPTTAVHGPFTGSGSLNMYFRPDTIGHFLKWAFGKLTTTRYGTSAMYGHKFQVLATGIKSFTLSDNRADVSPAINSRFLAGCLSKKVTVEAPARELMTITQDVLYAWEDLATAPAMGSLSTLRPFVYHDATGSYLTIGGTAVANVETFSISLENDFPDDAHAIGSRKLTTIEPQAIKITGEIEAKFKSWDMRQRFYGGAAASEPQEEPASTPVAMVLTLTGAATSVPDKPNYEMVFNHPNIILEESTSPVSKRERLKQRFKFTVLRDANNYWQLSNKVVSYHPPDYFEPETIDERIADYSKPTSNLK